MYRTYLPKEGSSVACIRFEKEVVVANWFQESLIFIKCNGHYNVKDSDYYGS